MKKILITSLMVLVPFGASLAISWKLRESKRAALEEAAEPGEGSSSSDEHALDHGATTEKETNSAAQDHAASPAPAAGKAIPHDPSPLRTALPPAYTSGVEENLH